MKARKHKTAADEALDDFIARLEWLRLCGIPDRESMIYLGQFYREGRLRLRPPPVEWREGVEP